MIVKKLLTFITIIEYNFILIYLNVKLIKIYKYYNFMQYIMYTLNNYMILYS